MRANRNENLKTIFRALPIKLPLDGISKAQGVGLEPTTSSLTVMDDLLARYEVVQKGFEPLTSCL